MGNGWDGVYVGSIDVIWALTKTNGRTGTIFGRADRLWTGKLAMVLLEVQVAELVITLVVLLARS